MHKENHCGLVDICLVRNKPKDVPLPATVAFVTGLGILIVVGWLLMFHLLTVRW